MVTAFRIEGESWAMAEVRSDGDENFCWLKSSKNLAISCLGDMGKSDFDGNEDVRVFQVLGILKTESERKERDRQILKKSKVMWEEGTVEKAWEREKNVCEWGEGTVE